MTAELSGYVDEMAARLSSALGNDLIGGWLLGSAALGGFSLERSDVDIMIVSRTLASLADRRSVAELIGPDSLACPAQGLEFVWYAQADVQPLGDPPSYQLNLNGGRLREHKIQFGPGEEADHWFVIDLAIGRACAVPFLGPALADVAAPIPRPRLLAALRSSLAWHDENDTGSPNRVLNAARTIRFLETGAWTNKLDAGRWLARTQPGLSPALEAAERARDSDRQLDPELAAQVVEAAQSQVRQAQVG
jgi:hypothetical protein